MLFAGDDTSGMFLRKLDMTQLQQGMKKLCAAAQTNCAHGLGLILKKPKTDYKRANMLSKNFGLFDDKVIMTRMPEKIVLTCSMQPKTLTVA